MVDGNFEYHDIVVLRVKLICIHINTVIINIFNNSLVDFMHLESTLRAFGYDTPSIHPAR